MLDVLTSKQLSEWQAYDRLDPIGSKGDDYRMAYLSSLIVNIAIQRFGKEGAQLTEVNDFIPEWDGEKSEENNLDDKIKTVMVGIANSLKNKKQEG